MGVPSEHILPSRVLNEDHDFITLEVAKHGDVTFHLQQNDEGETVGGDRFLTVIFVHHVVQSDSMETWLPWTEGA